MNKPLITITGATSGIGLETAKKFSHAGFPLLLIGRKIEALQKLQLPNCIIAAVDVCNLAAIQEAIQHAENQYGTTDAIINNAGVMLLGNLIEQDPAEWQTMLNTNVLGLMNGMKAVMASMKSRERGTIINISSIAGIKPFPNHAAYTATKFAVHGLSDNVREELAPYNVRVMTIAPGAVETPLLSHTNNEQIKADYQAWKKEIGGALCPKQVADVILFAYQQPQPVNLREIVLSATKQTA